MAAQSCEILLFRFQFQRLNEVVVLADFPLIRQIPLVSLLFADQSQSDVAVQLLAIQLFAMLLLRLRLRNQIVVVLWARFLYFLQILFG